MATKVAQAASLAFTLAGGLLIAFVVYLWSQVGTDATTPAIIFGIIAAGLLFAGRSLAR